MNVFAPVLLACAVLTGPVLAQPKAGDHAGHHGDASAAAKGAAADMADGEVRKVDKAAAKLTLKHGEIKNLDMPGMTMVFQVKEPAWLDQLKVGDKVRFRAEKSGATYVVVAIEAAR